MLLAVRNPFYLCNVIYLNRVLCRGDTFIYLTRADSIVKC